MRGRANQGVLWVYRARRGSRQRKRCTWAVMRAHLREEGAAAAKEEARGRGRGRPRVDTGSRPAPDIGSSCPGPKCRPVACVSRARKRDSGCSLAVDRQPGIGTPMYTSLPWSLAPNGTRGEKSECTRSSTHSSHQRRNRVTGTGPQRDFPRGPIDSPVTCQRNAPPLGIRCATHSYQRYSSTSRTNEFTRAVLSRAADRLETRVSLTSERLLDVRPYIKMASPPAWHPLAKPQPISRTLR